MTPERLAGELTSRLDGPHTDEHTMGSARLAAETVRYLNYATRPHAAAGLTEPATVYTVVGNLTSLVHGLTQTCDQLAGWIEREHAAGRLACDTRQPAHTVVEPALLQIHNAGQMANQLAATLAAAQTPAGHLKRPEPNERP